MSIQFIKGPGEAQVNPETFKKQYMPNNYMVTAHPLPRRILMPFECEGQDVIYLLRGNVKVEADGKSIEMNASDQLKMEGVKMFIVNVLSDTGTFFLKASKKVEPLAKAG